MDSLPQEKKQTAYELQVTRIGDTAEQHVDLSHREHALQATADNVLDSESLGLVDLSPGL